MQSILENYKNWLCYMQHHKIKLLHDAFWLILSSPDHPLVKENIQ